ncbi:hypothetical protein [Methylomonas sp. UP202]|uniref:hypothetical protein n=1 Tax=Methylomonas sp. UP202 TaxID=3040943 RepID=UPI0014388179|nr:hypothetical protein [Methylomonas sp. UP202]NJA07324.1 hypothetical protein [Methylococcaceae bacterium WWC4]WGS87262.1 hypothetical protein QC632_05800 [Methylomonas sp. UP202]
MPINSISAQLDMQRIVSLNEHIKEILRISSASYLVAINSMLISKASGQRLLGFGVVSSELRQFSRKLETAMIQLSQLTYAMSKKAAIYKKLSRERHLLMTTLTKSPRGEQTMKLPLQNKSAALLSVTDEFAEDIEKLNRYSKRTLQLCKAGNALARSAKIEAAHGGDMRQVLNEIAEQIEKTVLNIISLLTTLRASLEH